MKKLFSCILIVSYMTAHGQQDTTAEQSGALAQDDPSQFLTRMEVLNELQHREELGYMNITTVRSVIALGKRFTTRIEIPVMYNGTPIEGHDRYGLSDISIRLLGYKIIESRRSAMLASVELSFNTAQSPILGTGKNVISPVIAYSWRVPEHKTILAVTFQQMYSLWGDESRRDIRWTKLQGVYLHAWSRKIWTAVRPEFYLDHDRVFDASMNAEAYCYYRISNRFAVWIKGGTGLFGDHPARYQWTTETGLRYLMLRKGSLHLLER